MVFRKVGSEGFESQSTEEASASLRERKAFDRLEIASFIQIDRRRENWEKERSRRRKVSPGINIT